ncbi:MAG: proline dehydrogenase family protein [Chlamydiales bacterium]
MNFDSKKAFQLLESVRGKSLSRPERIKYSIDLAAHLVNASHHEATSQERKREQWLEQMMEDPNGKMFMTMVTDQCFRSQSSLRTTDQLLYLINQLGIPKFLTDFDRIKFMLFHLFGRHFPHFFIKRIRKHLKDEMAAVLLPEDLKEQSGYFEESRQQGVRINLNHIGEAILGEEEAERRLKLYLEDLARPAIEYISIKISTIYSQIDMIGWEHSLEVLSERLRTLYRTAKKNLFQQADGISVEKFVNLDMEEYRDLDLTIALFQKVLSEPEFLTYQGGIVLQSYLPDSFIWQQKLTDWAVKRVEQGGAPIKIRLVKGANLSMEAVESSQESWKQPPFETKMESDANFKRMLEYALIKEHAESVHIGIGSHNLFDIAYALILHSERGLDKQVGFEMLEGMAEPMRRVIHYLSGSMLLYCPEASSEHFQNAMAYLIRRLDENSGPENFLRHFYALKPDNSIWQDQSNRFIESCHQIDSLSSKRRREQNRLNVPLKPDFSEPFHNEPNTDFSLAENRKWAAQIRAEWKEKSHPNIPLVIGGEEIENTLQPGIDPSRPETPLYHYSTANEQWAEKALKWADEHKENWANRSFKERFSILAEVTYLFRKQRKELIGAMIADGAKTIWEADPEVSEAVDFIDYYRKNWEKFISFNDLSWSPKGIVLVAPPWNFPCSIPVGGIAAALVAGNSVLFKPAPEAVLVGWHLAQLFWEGGVPKEALQFINCADEPVGSYLVQHPLLTSVILTGATTTARKLLQLRPNLDLHAETGGKNAIIVSAMSDRDLAIRDIVLSAFGYNGQKCSACSLAVLEAEVYDSPRFLDQLRDAAGSLIVGSAWNSESKITPLIRLPEEALKRGLTQLEEGERWLLKPQVSPDNPYLWSPGIKIDVSRNSFTHQTEFFGPVLAVMRAESLDDAINLVNNTAYGLTSGLHSLDEREHHDWKEKIVAGNLYINRSITGAIVRRQPFGGCKASSVGPGAKAGGPNYVVHLAKAKQVELPNEHASLPARLVPLIGAIKHFGLSEKEHTIWKKSAESYAYWAEILKEPTDPSYLLGQDNYFYHIPLERAYLRLEGVFTHLSFLQTVAAALISETPLEISTSRPIKPLDKIEGISFIVEEENRFTERMAQVTPARIRLLQSPSESFRLKMAQMGIILQSEPVLANGRIELLHYLREISLSIDYHRYGYLGSRDPAL